MQLRVKRMTHSRFERDLILMYVRRPDSELHIMLSDPRNRVARQIGTKTKNSNISDTWQNLGDVVFQELAPRNKLCKFSVLLWKAWMTFTTLHLYYFYHISCISVDNITKAQHKNKHTMKCHSMDTRTIPKQKSTIKTVFIKNFARYKHSRSHPSAPPSSPPQYHREPSASGVGCHIQELGWPSPRLDPGHLRWGPLATSRPSPGRVARTREQKPRGWAQEEEWE